MVVLKDFRCFIGVSGPFLGFTSDFKGVLENSKGFGGVSRVFKGFLEHSRRFNPLEPDYFAVADSTSLASNTFRLLAYITGVIHDPPLRVNRVKRRFRAI